MTLLNHWRNNCLWYDKRSVKVNVNNLSELVSSHIAHRNSLNDTCIVYKNIDNAYFSLDFLNHFLYHFFVSYVANITLSVDTVSCICSHTLINKFLLNIAENNLSTWLCICWRNSVADTVWCTCYKCNFTFKTKV